MTLSAADRALTELTAKHVAGHEPGSAPAGSVSDYLVLEPI